MEVEMCDGKDPLVNPDTGHEFNCDEESCPSGSYCHRLPHQPSRCCQAGMLSPALPPLASGLRDPLAFQQLP